MSEIQENTEAKLASYIDGELEGADRAEIEKLLEQNPNYRRVLEQLGKTRDLLRALPRESAPPELTEAFNGQLERSVLLDGISQKRGGNLTITRWPQFAMAAAVAFLFIGLGAVVFLVLPRAKTPVVADSRSGSGMSGTPERSQADRETLRRSNRLGQRDEQSESIRNDTEAGRGLRRERSSIKPGATLSAVVAPNSPEVDQIAAEVYQNPHIQGLLTDDLPANNTFAKTVNPGKSDEALVMVVRSSDPQQVQRDVSDYFASNNITWSEAPEQVPLALNLSIAQNVLAAQRNESSSWERRLAGQDVPRETSKKYSELAPAEQSPSANASNGTSEGALRQSAVPQLSAQSPSAPKQLREGLREQPAAMFLPIDNVYVARRITRRQLAELNEALNRNPQIANPANTTANVQASSVGGAAQSPTDSLRLHDGFAGGAAPTTLPTTRPAAPSNVPAPEARSSVGNDVALPAPARDQKDLAAANSDEPAQNSTIAGMRYFRFGDLVGATQPSPTEVAKPADTQPVATTAPTTAPADQALDVVIVVQKDASLEPPAEVPAAPATTQSATTQP